MLMPQGLEWGRFDTSWYDNAKFAGLMHRRQWQAIAVYWAGLAYSIRQGTDGYVDPIVLPTIRATVKLADVLVDAGLWDLTVDEHGWDIHDFAEYQQTTMVTKVRRAQAVEAGRRGAAVRWKDHRA